MPLKAKPVGQKSDKKGLLDCWTRHDSATDTRYRELRGCRSPEALEGLCSLPGHLAGAQSQHRDNMLLINEKKLKEMTRNRTGTMQMLRYSDTLEANQQSNKIKWKVEQRSARHTPDPRHSSSFRMEGDLDENSLSTDWHSAFNPGEPRPQPLGVRKVRSRTGDSCN